MKALFVYLFACSVVIHGKLLCNLKFLAVFSAKHKEVVRIWIWSYAMSKSTKRQPALPYYRSFNGRCCIMAAKLLQQVLESIITENNDEMKKLVCS